MNLVLLEAQDFVAPDRAAVTGRRLRHVREVHRSGEGETLVVGMAGGQIGSGTIVRLDADVMELEVTLYRDPAPKLDLSLVLALPRPKVLNRVIAAATSMGVRSIHLINAWRVEKSYWGTPRLAPDSLRHQAVLGLEQAKDTVIPAIVMHRLFRPFVETELLKLAEGSRLIVAHPAALLEAPRFVEGAVTLVIGPEGGFIEAEIASLRACDAELVSLGPRVLRVETAIAALIGRMF